MLLVHGLGSCKEMWRPLLPALAREREVVAVDMPGFGASPPGPRTVEGLAEAVVGVGAAKGGHVPDPVVELDDVDAVVMRARPSRRCVHGRPELRRRERS